MRRVKKTTIEQFDLLKAEMAVHPAAARGYGVGAQRAIVDAEWKEIVDKLNALGPPERTMTEWKKVWSDLRLRSIKRLSEEFTPKPKKIKYKSKKNKLLETLCGSESIYASYGDITEQKCLSSPINSDDESLKEGRESYKNPLAEDEFDNTESKFYNTSNDDNSYGANSLKEEEEEADKIYHSDSNNYNSDYKSPRHTAQLSSTKQKYLGHTLSIIDQQMKNQNKIIEHLTKITSNLAMLMENHVTNMEKQNLLMERQLEATESHNEFLRRQDARTNLLIKCKSHNLQKS